MDPGRLYHRGAFSVAWRQQAGGLIWRIVPDHEGGLIGEVRDPTARGVSFFRVVVSSGEVVWDNATAPGGWWTGIECVARGVLLLHGFASPDLPGHRGLTALDLRTGAVLWHEDDAVFVAAAGSVAYALRGRPERRELVGRDLLNGTVVSADSAEEGRLRDLVTRWQGEAPPSPLFPEPVDAGTEEHALAGRLLAGALMTEGGVEMLRTDGVVITVHHDPVPAARGNRQAFRRVLSVFSGEAPAPAAAYREILDESVPVPVPDAFLVVNSTLLFVKDRRTLCAVHLSGRERKT